MRILLIDGYNFIHRANAGFKAGEYYIVFNFFRNLKSLIEALSPDKVFFVLEGDPVFRKELYSQYKANRIIKTADKKAQKDLFNEQKNEILRLLHYLPITCVKAKQYECDDVIATLAEDLKDEEVIVVSNDSDFIQLLQKNYKNFSIYNPFKKELMENTPYHYLTWKSLAGDKSDNIPSILSPEKSEKIALSPELLKLVLANDEICANFNLNLQLIQLRNIPSEELDFFYPEVDYDMLQEEFSIMDFKSILKDTYWDKFVSIFKSLEK